MSWLWAFRSAPLGVFASCILQQGRPACSQTTAKPRSRLSLGAGSEPRCCVRAEESFAYAAPPGHSVFGPAERAERGAKARPGAEGMSGRSVWVEPEPTHPVTGHRTALGRYRVNSCVSDTPLASFWWFWEVTHHSAVGRR